MTLNEQTFLKILQQGDSAGIFGKAVAGFILPDGTTRVIAHNTPENTVFDIASLTKVCPTSTLALSYILEGKLGIEDRVADHIPELQTNFRDDVRVFHLLTHSLDYRVPMKTLRTLPPEGILNALYTYQFEKAPGADFNYGNPASVLLGMILHRLTGKDLQALGRERFFEPLGMTRSGWDPLTRDFNKIEKAEIAPTEICAFRGRDIQGEIHDESAWVLRKLFPVGSAGMFSCVPDLLKFVQMILNDGVAAGETVAGAGQATGGNCAAHAAASETVAGAGQATGGNCAAHAAAGETAAGAGQATGGNCAAHAAAGAGPCKPIPSNGPQSQPGQRRVAPKGILGMVSGNAFARKEFAPFTRAMDNDTRKTACTALGWELNSAKFMGTHISPRAFGKTGFTGASIVADPDAGAAVVLLSDFTYPHREPNADRIHAFRAKLADEFFKSL